MYVLNILKVIALALIAWLTFFSPLFLTKIKIEKEKQEVLKNYEKNEAGLYPWEVDRDDNPKNIPKNAKKFVEKDRIRRGRWS